MQIIQRWKYPLLAVLMVVGMSSTTSNHHQNKTNMTTSNKEIVRKIYEECLNKRNTTLLKEYIADEYIGLKGVKGAAGFEAPTNLLIQAFPDIHWNVEELIAEGDKVLVKWTWEGTHQNAFAQYSSTGKKMSNEGLGIFELKNGKIIKSYVLTDRLAFLQQLNVLPADPAKIPDPQARKHHIRLVDEFVVPVKAEKEFMERMKINRELIQTLPGFVEDMVYQRTDEQGNLVVLTIAVWQNHEAINKAKELVQAEYIKQGFDISEMTQRLNITMRRGIYKEMKK